MAPITGGGPPVGSASGAFTGSAQSLDRVVEGWWYGYSNTGLITNAEGETTLFEFRAAVPLKLFWSPAAKIITLSQANKTFGYRLYLNDGLVWEMITVASTSSPETEQAAFYDKMFIVPRYTQVKITAQTTDDGGATFYGALTGEELG